MELDLIGLVVATLLGMFLGALWYSPILFGNAWMKSIGKTKETLGSQTAPLVGSIIASFLTALGVSILFSMIGVSSLIEALGLGLVLAVLIVFPALLSDNLFCGWGRGLLFIQSGYRMLSVILMPVVIFLV